MSTKGLVAPNPEPRTPPKPLGPPKTAPQPSGGLGGVITIIGVLAAVSVCPFEGEDTGKKKHPKGQPRKKTTKYVPPCGKESPEITHEERRRLVFVFAEASTTSINPKPASKSSRYKRWYKENYEKGEGVRLEIVIASDEDMQKANDPESGVGKAVRKNTTWHDPGRSTDVPPGSILPCYYSVFEIGKRRKCKCPDGSRCKKSKKEKLEGGYSLPPLPKEEELPEPGYSLPGNLGMEHDEDDSDAFNDGAYSTPL